LSRFRSPAGRRGWNPPASIFPQNRETKQLPIYALVVAKKDGKLGPQLAESTESSCTQPDPTKPPAPPDPGKPPQRFCGGMGMGPAMLKAPGIPIANMTPMLSRLLGRTVVDKTRLTGNFDISLEWTPDESQAMQFAPDGPRPPLPDPTGPSIFTALQE
jgi:bla regulator protein blaR1